MVIDHGSVIAEGTATQLKARLGATIVEVGFADAATAQRARGVLAGLGTSDVEADGHTVELKSNDGARVAIDVVRALDAEGLEPGSLALREPTLDDVFLSLTGHAAEAPSPGEPVAAGRKRTRGAA